MSLTAVNRSFCAACISPHGRALPLACSILHRKAVLRLPTDWHVFYSSSLPPAPPAPPTCNYVGFKVTCLGLVADSEEALLQQRKLHVRGHLGHEPPVLAQHIPRATHQRVMRGALLQSLQNLHPCKLHWVPRELSRIQGSYSDCAIIEQRAEEGTLRAAYSCRAG